MNLVARRFASLATLAAAALALGACSASSSPSTTSNEQSPLVGTWTYSGSVPDSITVYVSFEANKAFTFVETVAPATTPAATPDAGDLSGNAGCVVEDSYEGTYDTTSTGGTNTLTMNFASGTANRVYRCTSGSGDSPGQAMDQAAIDSYRGQGLIPAPAETYDVTSTTLVLTPPNSTGTEGGFNTSTKTLTKTLANIP